MRADKSLRFFSAMNRRLLLLPGMTPSRRIFEKLAPHLAGCEMIDWGQPSRAITITEYARTLVDKYGIDSTSDLLGVSFGGIVAQEIASHCGARLCFVVSSISSPAEIRPAQRVLARLPQQCQLSALRAIGNLAHAWPKATGSTVRARKFYGREGEWFRWATTAVLQWQPQPTGSTKIIRIHGDRDRTFPQSAKYADHLFAGAGHLLAITHSHALAEIIKQRQKEIHA